MRQVSHDGSNGAYQMTVMSQDTLSRLSEFIASVTGLQFMEPDWTELGKKLCSAAGEFGFSDPDEFISWLLSAKLNRDHIEILAHYLTIGETYFFRDNQSFKVIEEHILPELIRRREKEDKRLRIWCAGCSSGEEPYSVAILLKGLIPEIRNWNVTILATDINSQSLKKASQGIYSEWSFRSTTPFIRERYFRKTREGRYEILSGIKGMVTFAYLNLADDVFPSLLNNTNAMDIIFSRNVLMYLSNTCSKKVIMGFYNSLIEGGTLLVSPTDPVRMLSDKFISVNFPGVILYKKDENLRKVDHRDSYSEMNPVSSTPVKPLMVQDINQRVEVPAPVRYEREAGARDECNAPEKGQPVLFEDAVDLYRAGCYAEAIKKLGLLVSEGHAPSAVSALMARAYANKGMLDEALEWCKRALSTELINPAYHYMIATVLLEKDMHEEAIRSLKNSIYLDPDFMLSYFMLGNIMLKKGSKDAAVKYLKNANELLSHLSPEDVIPESDGITAGRLTEIINMMMSD